MRSIIFVARRASFFYPACVTSRNGSYEYDVCLSFAGEQRRYVHGIADGLRQRNIRVFYDDYETTTLWGKDLYQHLDWVYQRAARYCVLFASADYASKIWTSHERRSAQARALEEREEYILPVRFDDTEIPGVRRTIAYVDLRNTTQDELLNLIVNKIQAGRQNVSWPSESLVREEPDYWLSPQSGAVARSHEPHKYLPRTPQAVGEAGRMRRRAISLGQALALSVGYISTPFIVVYFVGNDGHTSDPMSGIWQITLWIACLIWLISCLRIIPRIFRRVLRR